MPENFLRVQVYWYLGGVSLTFRELSKIFSRNLCISEIVLVCQSHALGTRTKFQLEILTTNVISGVVNFHEIILETSRNVFETTPWSLCVAPCPCGGLERLFSKGSWNKFHKWSMSS